MVGLHDQLQDFLDYSYYYHHSWKCYYSKGPSPSFAPVCFVTQWTSMAGPILSYACTVQLSYRDKLDVSERPDLLI